MEEVCVFPESESSSSRIDFRSRQGNRPQSPTSLTTYIDEGWA